MTNCVGRRARSALSALGLLLTSATALAQAPTEDVAPVVQPDAPVTEQAETPASVDVRISGVDDLPEAEALQRNVEAWLGFKAEAERKSLTATRVRDLHAAAAGSIAKAFAPFGYYETKVEATLSGGPERFAARYTITPGTPTRWRPANITVDGDDGEVIGDLADSLAPADVAVHRDYEALKTALVSRARERGYLDAVLTTQRLVIDPPAATARAELALQLGPRYVYGPVSFAGDGRIDTRRLRRYLPIVEGAPVSPRTILDAQLALSDLDYFGGVQIDPQKPEGGGVVPIVVSLQPAKARRDNLSLGYGTDTGPRFGAGTDFRRLNDRGDKLAVSFRVSQLQIAADTRWRIPFGDKPGQFLSLFGGINQQELPDARIRDIRLGIDRPVRWSQVTLTPYVRFSRSFTEVFGDETVDDRVPGETTLLTPGVGATWAKLDDPVRTQRGVAITADLHGGVEGALSDVSFLQAQLRARLSHPAPWGWRLLARGEYGFNLVRGFSELPLSERFLAGGDESVRGYLPNSISPLSDNGQRVGGKFLWTGSLEAEHRLWGDYGGALFWDAGGVADTPTPGLRHGVGLGLRYRAPFGAVRVDLAHPLDRDESPVRLHLGIRVGL